MNKKIILAALLPLALGAHYTHAQFTMPTAGSREITIGGSGSADNSLDDSGGGISLSYGKYTSDRVMWSLRQTINYSNPEGDSTSWNGSTRIAADYHFGDNRLRPLLGANVGYIYGDGVNDTWAAGLEGGLKYYVNDTTFVYGLLEYAWLFDDTDDVDDTFDDGRYLWSVGVGFNF